MTCVFVGKVTKIGVSYSDVRDIFTGTVYKCKIADKDLIDFGVGSEAIFVGEFVSNILNVRKLLLAEIVPPLEEQLLLELAGTFEVVELTEDPFPEAFEEIMAAEGNENVEK